MPDRPSDDIERAVTVWELTRRHAPAEPLPTVPDGLPSPRVLASRCFPPEMLERRRRFLVATGAAPLSLADRLAVAGTDLPPPDPAEADALDAFFDRVARDRRPPLPAFAPAPTRPPAWSRLEACVLGSDRWFGRGRHGRLWSAAARAAGRAGELKRSRWP